MSRQSKTNKYAYAAGLIDGEGCIHIKRYTDRDFIGDYCYSLMVIINMSDGESLDYMKGCFGGNIHKNSQSKYGKLPAWTWELYGRKAAEFLKRIFPFLRIKKAQAELAMRFQLSIRKKNIGVVPLPQTEREFRHWCYEQMKRLKATHNPPRAGVTTECEYSSDEGKLQSELVLNETQEAAT